MGDRHLGARRSLDLRGLAWLVRVTTPFRTAGVTLAPAFLLGAWFASSWRDTLYVAVRSGTREVPMGDFTMGLLAALFYAVGLGVGVAFTLHRVKTSGGPRP